ncbi:thioredoxin fold domain-containing protein [Helicobacter burdigaliensis]|uniref:thioredoxin fold domain-containing protein n=1 Tax=Helicobacter burdigaliensis TaxID=2315334 RepID=UPI000EF65054|nr:thioredoxin fold domain-containing protein [Helicobacter burdigaliensis]
MKKIQFLILAISIIFFIGCNEEDLVSSGTQDSTSHIEAMQNVDKNSYAEVADVFLDTKEITTKGDRPYFLVFAANGCIFCDKLKTLIKENEEVKKYIQENYSPYYINLSYTKEHKISFMQDKILNTQELGEYFSIKPTPTMVFLSAKGKILYVYPGFMPKERFFKTLKFLSDPAWESLEEKEIAKHLQEFLEK